MRNLTQQGSQFVGATAAYLFNAKASVSTLTINEVTFASDQSANAVQVGFGSAPSVDLAGFTNESDLDKLLDYAWKSPIMGSSVTVSLSGLTVGTTYVLELFTPNYGNSIRVSDGASSWSPVFGGLNAGGVIGEFVASSSIFSFLVAPNPSAASTQYDYAEIAAISVFQSPAVPEPSAFAAILGLVAAVAAFWVRRDRSAAG